MKLLVLTITLLGSVSSWDCYDQNCWGSGTYWDTLVTCDQSYQHCDTMYNGWPLCQIGYSGNGTYCYGDYYCSYYSYDGRAYCSSYNTNTWFIGYGVGSVTVLVIIILCCCRCCRRRRQAALRQTVVIQQNAPAPVVSPAVIQNINVVAPPANYGATAYPARPGGYPAQPSGYPSQQGGYPAQPSRYPAQQQQPGQFAEQPPPYDVNAPPKNEY